jgi:hypothetical protein
MFVLFKWDDFFGAPHALQENCFQELNNLTQPIFCLPQTILRILKRSGSVFFFFFLTVKLYRKTVRSTRL